MMKATLLASAAAFVAAQPFPFNLPPRPLTSACFLRSDPEAQCCVDPAAIEWGGGCAGLKRKFGPVALESICCPSSTECCPTEFYHPDNDDRVSWTPKFSCCDGSKGKACEIDTATGKGVCADADSFTTEPMNNWNNRFLDGDGRCSVDGSIPLWIAPNTAFRCSVNRLLPFKRECPTGATCTKDRQANANTGVCCRNSHCQTKATCQDCVTPLTSDEFDALSSDERRTTQPVCSWLTQGDRYNIMPRCVTSCKHFPDKSCIVGGISRRAVDLCPNNNANMNGTNYNTGTCKRSCGRIGTGRSSRINNNGNSFSPDTPPAGHETTKCCTRYNGDYCCDPWMGLATHCTAGYVNGGPQCGVPMRGSPNTFYNTPPPYWGNGNFPPQRPQFRPPGFPIYGPPMGQPGFNWGGLYGGIYGGGNFGMYRPPVYGGMFRAFDDRSGEDDRAGDMERAALFTPLPTLPGTQFIAPPVPPRVPNGGFSELPVPSDQFRSDYICSCDSECGAYDDCCSDLIIYCPGGEPVVEYPVEVAQVEITSRSTLRSLEAPVCAGYAAATGFPAVGLRCVSKLKAAIVANVTRRVLMDEQVAIVTISATTETSEIIYTNQSTIDVSAINSEIASRVNATEVGTTIIDVTGSPTSSPTTVSPTTGAPTTAPTGSPTTVAPTTGVPTTLSPTTGAPTGGPTSAPTTRAPTTAMPTTAMPTNAPSVAPTNAPSVAPTGTPTTRAPTTSVPTTAPTTTAPTGTPTKKPTPLPTRGNGRLL